MCAPRVKNHTCTRWVADSTLDAHSKESLRSLASTLYTHEQSTMCVHELLSPGRRCSFPVTLSTILHVTVYFFIVPFHSWNFLLLPHPFRKVFVQFDRIPSPQLNRAWTRNLLPRSSSESRSVVLIPRRNDYRWVSWKIRVLFIVGTSCYQQR